MRTNPRPFCVQTSSHSGLGTGMFFAVILVIGAIASAAYSYFRLNKRRVGFQHFEVRQRKTGTWWWGVLSETQPLALAGPADRLLREAVSSWGLGTRVPSPGWGLCPSAAVVAPRPASWQSQALVRRVAGCQVPLRARALTWRQTDQGPGSRSPWTSHKTCSAPDGGGFRAG